MSIKKIVEKFEKFGLVHDFLKQNARIVVGMSGGPDSLALALLLLELRQKYSLFIIVAHVNYHLRDSDSDLDERFVKEFCFKQNLPIYLLQAKIENKNNLQKEARDIRFEYFRKLKKYYRMDYIALGHQMNDQTETVLQRMLRGSGFTGLSGIHPKRDGVIHPLINISKENLVNFVKLKGFDFRIDKTNDSNLYARNKIRNDLLPLLKKEYNPNIEKKLIENGNLFYMAETYFNHQAKRDFKKAFVSRNESDIVLDINHVKQLFPILRFYVCREAWSMLTKSEKDFYSIHYAEIEQIVDTERGYKEIDLPDNVVVIKDYHYLTFRKNDKYQTPIKELSKVITSVRNVFSFNEYRFTMQKTKQVPEEGLKTGFEHIVVDLDKLVFPITMRYRQSGDKFIPFGRNGLKKLKDFFIDEKVSKFDRDNVVIFSDAEKIFWVCGYRLDQRVAVTNETKNFLQVKLDNNSDIKNRSAERKVRNRG